MFLAISNSCFTQRSRDRRVFPVVQNAAPATLCLMLSLG
jgi:hypothetical protein